MARGKKTPTTVPNFGHIERRKGTRNWYLVYRPAPGADRIVRSARTTDQKAAYDGLVDLAGKYARGEMARTATATTCTFNHLFGLLEKEYRANKRTSVDDMVARVNKHLRPWFGAKRVIELRKHDIETFVDSRLNGFQHGRDIEKLSPASVNKLLAFLKHSLRPGAKEDPPLVLRVPDWFKKVPGERVRTGIISPDVYEALKKAMEPRPGATEVTSPGPHMRLAFVIAYHTGMRRGAILSLRWEWVDWHKNLIVIPPDPNATTKHKPRMVPIYGEMRSFLEMAHAAAETEWIIEFRGERVRSLKTAWHGACERAGLTSPPIFHDFRRTAITRMEEAGLQRYVAMEMSGHKTEHVYVRYQISSPRKMQDAGQRMEAQMAKEAEVSTKSGHRRTQ